MTIGKDFFLKTNMTNIQALNLYTCFLKNTIPMFRWMTPTFAEIAELFIEHDDIRRMVGTFDERFQKIEVLANRLSHEEGNEFNLAFVNAVAEIRRKLLELDVKS